MSCAVVGYASIMTAVDRQPGTDELGRAGRITNWVLALATVPGAIAVVVFLYMQIMGTAGCSDQTCPRQGPGELGFTMIQYGAPIVAPCVTSSESGGTRSTPSGSDR